ncbi:hypothetical protein FQN51_005780 [Onygenales sp. PD_10]|nr:hypothetical protein FQN51_005780 [Onygenales sp. PD_10]
MLCQSCRTSLLHRLPFRHQTTASLQASRCAALLPRRQIFRQYSTPAAETPAAAAQSQSAPSIGLPGVAAPTAESAAAASKAATAPRILSGTPAGTKLKGLNYMKNKPEVFALEDHEYPDWLWGLLDDAKAKGKGDGGVDVSTMNKKQRLRHEKKMAAKAAAEPRKIPLHEQAIDITSADAVAQSSEPLHLATDSINSRSEITKSARVARRKGIQEANFLSGM